MEACRWPFYLFGGKGKIPNTRRLRDENGHPTSHDFLGRVLCLSSSPAPFRSDNSYRRHYYSSMGEHPRFSSFRNPCGDALARRQALINDKPEGGSSSPWTKRYSDTVGDPPKWLELTLLGESRSCFPDSFCSLFGLHLLLTLPASDPGAGGRRQ